MTKKEVRRLARKLFQAKDARLQRQNKLARSKGGLEFF